eukprot:jgi/Tetstr1/442693/TSEL_030784.t1
MERLGYGSDGLPQEILSVLPQDPYAQLQLAYRISNNALSQKAGQLENDAQQLRHALSQKSNHSNMLEQRVAQLENELHDMHAKHKMAMEATQKLSGEKNALINTVKKLNRDVAKLESFKRNLMNTLRDDDDPSAALQLQSPKLFSDASMGGSLDASSDRLISNVLAGANSVPMGPATSSPTRSQDSSLANGMKNFGGLGSPRMAPDGSHHMGGYSDYGGGSPRPPQARTAPTSSSSSPRMDGKEFFRQARARLSYEQFSHFLQNIKELNAGRQSREDTLSKARDIFGSENGDLYASFEGLLSRHLPAM